MTRAIHGRFLKDENDAISDHLRNHVHLTNCIHLRNHMHRQSPILAERSLMRDLIVLQRSRSLRDPSTSPPSWHSPSILESLSRKLEKDSADGRRRSGGLERRREARRLSGNSPPVASLATSKVAAEDVMRGHDGRLIFSSNVDGVRDVEGIKGEESSRKSRRSDQSAGTEEPPVDGQNLVMVNELVQGKADAKDKRISRKGKQSQNIHLKTLSEQLNEFPIDSDGQSSCIHHNGGCRRHEKNIEEPEASNRSYRNELNRAKKRRFRGVRITRASMGSRDFGVRNDLSVASNSLAQNSTQRKYYMEGGEEEGENAKLDVSRGPRNGCGIPWNWSRIHHRGKTFLDLAGRSLSCGLSDSRLRKEGSLPEGRDNLDMAVASESSSLSAKFHAEAAPLLVERSGSQGSTDNAAWVHDYSGELGIFADHSLKHDVDSDFASEAGSDRQKSRGYRHGRHQSLTQKYLPRTFKDLVGQNLVAQALSNAVLKRKVGFLYVFYGPHGTGKTSCARIFARALNCQSSEHPKPCGVCNSCIAHDLGKSRNVREVGPVSNFDFESIMDLLDSMIISQLQSQYRVFIFDDCDTLPPDSWSAISKVIDRAPRRWIATKEGLEIDKDALKLIASRSDGSLRDAQMTLEQLSLLGQRISVPLVQELVGLISDEKLVDLLDLALSADTVNTVKNLREIMEAGVEPLALMSQLATIITDILAGSYVFTQERLRRKFFRRLTLSKEDMEKLRQALKTLSEAEKQLRTSNDKLTWLTAALLQLAPDKLYMLPSSSADTSFNHSPLVRNNPNGRDLTERGFVEHAQMSNSDLGLPTGVRIREHQTGSAADVNRDNIKVNGSITAGKKNAGMTPLKSDVSRASAGCISGKDRKEIEEIWLGVLDKIEINTLKQFMHEEGKLVSVSFGAAPTVQLTFSSHMTKSKAEKFRGHILQAFESVLGSPVTIEIRCESRKDVRGGVHVPLVLPASEDGTSRMITYQESLSNNSISKAGYDKDLTWVSKGKVLRGSGSKHVKLLPLDFLESTKNEIIEIASSSRQPEGTEHSEHIKQIKGKGLESPSSLQQSSLCSLPKGRKNREHPQSQSIVRSKVSLAHVIQQAEGSQRNGWTRRKAISIAEKLEQENL
ncbi:AAA+ ATPase domain [Macleaya cordata]|uniref:AAA+ ATPase domain n=1 Tax=Macleaya cordata TaxID=56857 RepID=A0A200Q0Y3_MACCD|nr:AAA+ ATPase domain [Macleaya cordata]